MADYSRWFATFNRRIAENYALQYFAIKNGKLIEKRIEEIETGSGEADINSSIRGTGTNSDRVALIAVKKSTDTELSLYREVVSIVESVFDELNDEQLDIVFAIYDNNELSNQRYSKSIKQVSKELGKKPYECTEARDIFLNKIVSKVGCKLA